MKKTTFLLGLAAMAALTSSSYAEELRLVRNVRLGDRVTGFLSGIAQELHNRPAGPVCAQLAELTEGGHRVRVGRGPCPAQLLTGAAVLFEAEASAMDLGQARCGRLGCFILSSSQLTTRGLDVGLIEDATDAAVTEFGPVSELTSLCTQSPHSTGCRLLVNSDGAFGGVAYRPYRYTATLTPSDALVDALRRDGFNVDALPCFQQVRRPNGDEALVLGYLANNVCVAKPMHTASVLGEARISNGNIMLGNRVAGTLAGQRIETLCSGPSVSVCYFARERGRIVSMNPVQ